MILVPVKNLECSKQRLSPALSPQQRRQLAEAMLEDVLDALGQCSERNAVAVVTGDPQAQRLAQTRGLAVIPDPANPGETGAIAMATDYCRSHGAGYTLVIPGDIPLIQTGEVEAIFAAAPREGALLVPSASGRGTNAAFRRPADLFPLRFGNDSFKPHLAAAQSTGKEVKVLQLSGIGLDVDEPADLADLLQALGATRAQQLVRQWGPTERWSVAHV